MSKKLIVILSVLTIILLTGIFCLVWFTMNWHKFDYEDETVDIPQYDVRVYDEIYLDDLLNEKTDKNIPISTDKLGKSIIEYD